MAPTTKSDHPPIDLTAESSPTASNTSDDEDLRQAIALSFQSAQVHAPEASSPVKASANNAPTFSTTLNSLLGMDRKQMEQDRLARLKRKRGEEVSPPPLTRRTKTSITAIRSPTTVNVMKAPSARRNSPSQVPQSQPASISNQTSTSPSRLKYPVPVVLQTWCFGFLHTTATIKLEELLDAPNLEVCVLSSFIWNHDWLFPKFDTKRTKFVLVMHGKDPRQRNELREDFDGIPNVRLCFPPMDGNVNCMHSKLMLLFYPTQLRIAVPTANLTPFDWGEDGGVMENSVFVIDLPRLTTAPLRNNPDPDPPATFYNSLIQFLVAQHIPPDVLQKLTLFNFSPLANIGFVHSIGGSHSHPSLTWRTTGHPGLGRTITSLGLRTTEPIQLDFVTSSVGSLTSEFLRSIYLAAQGDDGLTEYTLRTAKKLPAPCEGDKNRMVSKEDGHAWKDNFRFYFPSTATVEASRGGSRKAGTICFSSRWWDGPKFPRQNMRDCVSVREGLLMHNKILFVRFSEPLHTKAGQEYSGWAYVGSANLSESAWGRLVQDKNTKAPKLGCKNYECGVVIPVPKVDKVDGQGLEHFNEVVPVPMRCPGETFEGKRPWFFQG